MKGIASLVLILVTAFPGLAQEAKVQPKDKPPDYYPVKVGTKWEYKVGVDNVQPATVVYRISKIEGTGDKALAVLEQLVNDQVQATEHIGVREDGVYRYRLIMKSEKATTSEFSPPVCLLKYPVKEGSYWETGTKLGTKEFTVIGREGPLEEVEVPAGKYKAIKVKIETTVTGTKVNNTYWFAPEVGLIKQTAEYMPGKSFTMELAKFEEGK